MKEKDVNQSEGVLGFTELWALGIGQVIGAGVITLIGPAIGLTGHSVWLAYLVAILLGGLTNLPIIIFSSVTKYSGGDYSIITMLGGQKIGGMYIVGFSLQMLGMSLFATALGIYVHSMFPMVNGTIVGIVFLVLFYIINMMGIANMANAQKLMSAILIAALLMFIIGGAIKADFSKSFRLFDGSFYMGGASGFWSAVMLLVYSCQGYKFNVNYGGQTRNPTRNMPLSMLAVIPVLIVVYCGAALIASSVLPLDQVAGKPLTLVAQTVLPKALFYAFMFGGPIMALLTTMNSSFAAMVGPFTKASKDGWFPAKLGATNKRGGAYIILSIQLVVGLVPVLLNFSVGQIVNNLMLITTIYNFLLFFSLLRMPKKMPAKWKQATMHMPNGVYYAILALAFMGQALIGWNSMRSLTLPLAIFNVVALAICFVYAIWRHNSGRTHVDTEGMLELE
ncbi:APC family permease [Breznakiella homolactica]|uniref:Amino acid permease n=1 Tax=Breznakiella homolactica TaxID=2798577 RepID=A0A7T8BAQ4_9SPIR|nr:amino acid permease [Breznakiella homolactica]QQO08403.1 amino acid permease [Breznakiella homolactica]